MSDHAPPVQQLPPGVDSQVEDHIGWGRILSLGAIALVIFAIGAAFAVWMLVDVNGSIHDGTQGVTPEVAKGDVQIGIVEQRQIELETRAQDLKRARREQLDQYGWVDREKNVIRIPVEEGIKKVVEAKKQ